MLITSGPLQIFGSLPLSIFPICRAMSVLPVPGGPCSSMPFTWWMPSRCTTDCGNTRLEKARRKMSSNCLSSPPMPSFSNEKSFVLNSCELTEEDFWFAILIAEACAASNKNVVSGVMTPRMEVTPSATPSTSMELMVMR